MTSLRTATAPQEGPDPKKWVPMYTYQCLWREKEQLERRVEQLEGDKKHLLQFKKMHDFRKRLDVIPNTVVSPVTKSVFVQCEQVFSTRPARDDGYVPVVLDLLSKPIGSTIQTVRHSLSDLRANQLIDTKVEKDETGRSHLLIRPINFTLEALAKSEATGHGGKRVAIHREHGCGGLCKEQVTYECTRCGEVNIRKEHVLMVDEDKWERWQAGTQETLAAATHRAGHHAGLHPEDTPYTTAPTAAAPSKQPKRLLDYVPPPEEIEPLPPLEPEEEPYYPGMPSWLRIGSADWNKQVKRCGLVDMTQRRENWIRANVKE